MRRSPRSSSSTRRSTRRAPTTSTWVSRGRLGFEEDENGEPANDAEHFTFGFIYALGVLSFADTRPRGVSEMHFEEGEDDIVFFADEGGSWQVDVDWPNVLPAYFRSLSATAAPEEYVTLANAIIEDFVGHDAPKYLSRARGAAMRGQKAAMKAPMANTRGARTSR